MLGPGKRQGYWLSPCGDGREASVGFLATQGSLRTAACDAGQLQRRIVSETMTAQHILNLTPAQAEIVQKALVEIGKAVRGKTIMQRDTKGSEPGGQTNKTRGKRPARPRGGEVEVKIEDPIGRAHGVILSAGTRILPRPQTRTGDEGWRWTIGRKPVGDDYVDEDAERILISPTNVSNDSHQPF